MEPDKKPTVVDVYYRVCKRISNLKNEMEEKRATMSDEDVRLSTAIIVALQQVANDMETLEAVRPQGVASVASGLSTSPVADGSVPEDVTVTEPDYQEAPSEDIPINLSE